MDNKQSVFAVLNSINCNEHTEKKNGLTYLSWAWAWQIVKQNFPDANYTIYENPDGWNYFTDGRTCWVKTGVTIEGQEHIEELPVMDFRNNSIPFGDVTSFDVNKAIQRSLTKAVARHGLGLYIYAGEDLPDASDDDRRTATRQASKPRTGKSATAPVAAPAEPEYAPMDNATYWTLVAAEAVGRRAKDGRDIKTAWKETTHAKPEHIAKFDHDVENYRIAHNINQ